MQNACCCGCSGCCCLRAAVIAVGRGRDKACDWTVISGHQAEDGLALRTKPGEALQPGCKATPLPLPLASSPSSDPPECMESMLGSWGLLLPVPLTTTKVTFFLSPPPCTLLGQPTIWPGLRSACHTYQSSPPAASVRPGMSIHAPG